MALVFCVSALQGTLRDALDNGMLVRGSGRCMHPGLAVGLAQDIAAALLHMHAEGVCACERACVRASGSCGRVYCHAPALCCLVDPAVAGLALRLAHDKTLTWKDMVIDSLLCSATCSCPCKAAQYSNLNNTFCTQAWCMAT
jgi:hypothetical protein